ncbi:MULTISPECIES: excinuclease ABC subunit UvrC [unclassified Agarivorans]|uniref:excinuclease ABC subunit UvrC n=1 Tax=unclassified Agarivorans TaxID=2636026 RepID=UPI0026E40CE7|nr:MULTISPECIES: excinuclease ABC subunit UvrC [unclassified Agarivorans]MDO6684996.1 excinuclease ABC subunit UvrC [Agarivorans sp. 3_MG-2023]MDO6714843.1 excinuclease ABC subunit UvrC [Agarivorans sp. 2_MG-2023]
MADKNTPFDSKAFLNQVSEASGIYMMFNAANDVIYVGKAKSLKKRLSSYFRKNVDSNKTRALVSNIANIEVTVTHTETEALILEHNLIKKYLPKYNVLLRDDKSYPYILISNHKHPRISMHRGAKRTKGDYFGPYPNGNAVRESLHLMQKLFPIRQCSDSEYANRQRPCLQYQLKRCSAPCVNFISEPDYQQQVDLASMFLKGKSQQVINQLVDKMSAASDNLNFEAAAGFRDQIQAMRKVQEQQFVSGNTEHSDVLGFAFRNGIAVVHLLLIRDGQVLGSRSYYPKVPKQAELPEVLRSFVMQYYFSEQRKGNQPNEVLLPDVEGDWPEIEAAIESELGTKVKLTSPKRGEKLRFVALANTNAENALLTKLNQEATIHHRVTELESLLEQDKPIKRMECFDISHTQGERTVASCVVFDRQGPNKSEYRRFNIEGITGGDDYAAMAQALKRRYQKAQLAEKIPDVLFIDGGKGQLSAAFSSIEPLNLDPMPLLVGVAKGVTRKPGLETLLIGKAMTEIHLPSDSAALHLIQHIRDESHRFAITGHRNRRDKARKTSVLEDIPGIGAKRRQTLLTHLGGMQQMKNASVDELKKVPGISPTLAQKIFDTLHH